MWSCSNSGIGRRAIPLAVVVALSCAACGYALAGRGSFLPESVKTIGIPTFANSTAYYEIGQILTEKVRTEFIGRGKYQILPESDGVDAVLTGQVTGISVAPASFTQQQQASRYIITITASIELKDAKTDLVLWNNPAMSFQEEYDAASTVNPTDPAAFFGQESNAVQRVTTEFARTVVSAILEAF
jgi:hypothetical protein